MDRSSRRGRTARSGAQLTAIVSGMVGGVPHQGGATWAVLQYLLGLRRLGCQVYFVEPVEGAAQRADEEVRYCAEVMNRFGLGERWSLVPVDGGEPAGMSRRQIEQAAAEADLLVNVSGMLADPDVLGSVAVRVFLDLDPAFVQLWHSVERLDMRLDAHTHFVTVADAIGDPACPIPTCGRGWIPTLPPVVLEEWPWVSEPEREGFTTVAHWRGYGSIHHEGVHFGQKVHSWRAIMDLPRRTDEPFEPALEIHPGDECDVRALAEHGWRLRDPCVVAGTPDDYRRFVQDSRAELGVAKSGYVVSGSGWFSDRSACYLASGRPVIAEDTGLGRRLPTGRGLFVFSDTDDVVEAVEQLRADYRSHRHAAREIAEQYLDSDLVLSGFLERVMA